ncbi:MAG TPA: hypothetical protein VFN53_07240 [Acidobacteriaceae bacterium]|nr:hypothetical protein [Acidobacteriaceae bacterium]
MGLQDVTKTDLYNKILDRRSFVTGVGVAGIGAAALGLAGCSSTAMKAMAQSSGSSDTAQNIFTAASANDPVQAFYFPTGTFDSLTNFFPVLIALETAFVAAYMTAVQEFSLMIGGVAPYSAS